MLIVTNRVFDDGKLNAESLTVKYKPFGDDLSLCYASLSSGKIWSVSNVEQSVSDQDILSVLGVEFSKGRPVLFYIHGNNNTPATCMERCKQLEDQYSVTVIGFSWASEGYLPSGGDVSTDYSTSVVDGDEESISGATKGTLRDGVIAKKAHRYQQAKINAQQSTGALSRFLRLLASARLASMAQPYSIAAHSLGCHFLHYAVLNESVAPSISMAFNVILIAGCTGAAKHSAWLGMLSPENRMFVTFNNDDVVLAAALAVDGDVKLGCSPGNDRLDVSKCRYIDFQNAKNMPGGGHRYFVAPPRKKLSDEAKKLFGRIFSSKPDINPGDKITSIYPVRCDADMGVCSMGGNDLHG